MIQDITWQFCTDLAITSSSVQSTNVVPMSAVLRSIGSGEARYIDVNVTEAFVGDGTLIMSIWADVSDTLGLTSTFLTSTGIYTASAGTSAQTLGAVTVNRLALGDHITIPIAPLSDGQIRFMKAVSALAGPYAYMGLQFDLTSGTFSAGKLSACLTGEPTSRRLTRDFADAIG